MAEEVIFLEERGVKVTNSRFVTFANTQAMAGITAVSSKVKTPDRKLPVGLIIAGIVIAIWHWFGYILIAGGIALFFLQKKKYIVELSSASGKTDALEDNDENFIGRVVAALNEAIIHRG